MTYLYQSISTFFLVDYLNEIRKWYSVLMPKIQPLLYGNGGPIIMVQIENEYGSFHACDRTYMEWLRDETGTLSKYFMHNIILFRVATFR